ncbi:hypothetical protein GCM10007320_11760 [Pseudorhodoferax aquiterrae]|uniref:DUF1289 domain-containing protein n=1 Tax=Pseudorhodoferax aquiterrae TaxID=747304 RepID=A0ABQ3FYT4_9BURK|nr:hypothetical protein GCM10007320_11760 [Pseudorhodoferax aquiterrae]
MTPAQALLRRGPRMLAAAGEVGSPCVSVCRMGADGLCEGCLRKLEEIAGWSRMDDAGRRAVWRLVLERASEAVA